MTVGRKQVAWVSICVGLCAGAEGMRTTPYYDVGGVPTACFGETKNIKMEDRFTPEQCWDLLAGRIEKDFGPEVDRCTKVPLTPERKAAAVDFAYNLGEGTYCKKIAPLFNAGKTQAGCDKMLEFNKARSYGVLTEFPGLTKRRHAERELCMKGLDDGLDR
jgi:lysozyme